jgi:putative endonuclease
MWNVYVLKSLSSGKHYVGISQDVDKRLREHNCGKSKFTSGHIPWELVYVESGFATAKAAREREKYLKTSSGKKSIQSKL